MPFQFLEKTFLKERERKTDRQTKRRDEGQVNTESQGGYAMRHED